MTESPAAALEDHASAVEAFDCPMDYATTIKTAVPHQRVIFTVHE